MYHTQPCDHTCSPPVNSCAWDPLGYELNNAIYRDYHKSWADGGHRGLWDVLFQQILHRRRRRGEKNGRRRKKGLGMGYKTSDLALFNLSHISSHCAGD